MPKANVRSARYLRRSLMPEGLLDALTDQQVADVVNYVRVSFGNRYRDKVTPAEVQALR